MSPKGRKGNIENCAWIKALCAFAVQTALNPRYVNKQTSNKKGECAVVDGHVQDDNSIPVIWVLCAILIVIVLIAFGMSADKSENERVAFESQPRILISFSNGNVIDIAMTIGMPRNTRTEYVYNELRSGAEIKFPKATTHLYMATAEQIEAYSSSDSLSDAKIALLWQLQTDGTILLNQLNVSEGEK